MPKQTPEYVKQRYQVAIEYYHNKAKYNRRIYQWTRYLTIILGSLVTLFAALSQNASAASHAWVTMSTALLAAVLTMLGGLTQSFQWGAAWRDMMITAAELERDLDRLRATDDEAIDTLQELDRLNDMVITETRSFFERVVGRADTITISTSAPSLEAPEAAPKPAAP